MLKDMLKDRVNQKVTLKTDLFSVDVNYSTDHMVTNTLGDQYTW